MLLIFQLYWKFLCQVKKTWDEKSIFEIRCNLIYFSVQLLQYWRIFLYFWWFVFLLSFILSCLYPLFYSPPVAFSPKKQQPLRDADVNWYKHCQWWYNEAKIYDCIIQGYLRDPQFSAIVEIVLFVREFENEKKSFVNSWKFKILFLNSYYMHNLWFVKSSDPRPRWQVKIISILSKLC